LLSEDTIDNLIYPIIERQERINLYALTAIAEQIKKIGELSPSSVYKLERLYKRGADVKKLNEKLAELAGMQVKDIKKLIKTVAEDVYTDAKPFYDYRKKPFIPFKENEHLQRMVKAVANQTAGEYVNLSKAQAFMIRDMKNPKQLIPTPPAKAYQSVVDEAIQAVQSGVVDYNTAIHRTVKQLSDSGLRVTYQAESGKMHTQSMEAAVTRNVLDGVKAINQDVQDQMAKEFGSDGKELSVHRYSAPDHEPIQGHQFSNEQYEKLQNHEAFHDYKGNEFKAIKRAIGVWNCRHYPFAIILGVSIPVHSDEELQQYMDENQKGYTDEKGKHRTMYECTQEQRRLERAIRNAKQSKIVAETAGDYAEATKQVEKEKRLTAQYKAFSKACGLEIRYDRIEVEGYTRKIKS